MGSADDIFLALQQSRNGDRLTDKDILTSLKELKVLGRDAANATAFGKAESIATLIDYSFDDACAVESSLEAMRCLANTMLLYEHTRAAAVDKRCREKAATLLKGNADDDISFLATRILFFCTYAKTSDLEAIVREYELAQCIYNDLQRHANRLSDNEILDPTVVVRGMALAESLKLLTNLVILKPTLIPAFTPCMDPIAGLLLHTPLAKLPLVPPITLMVNALMSLDLQPAKIEDADLRLHLSSHDDLSALTDRLVSVLDSTLASSTGQEQPDLDTVLPPLIALLTKLYTAAPTDVKSKLDTQLLPDVQTSSSREKPMGTDNSLPSRLLRLTASTSPSLIDTVGTLFFELSDRSPQKLVDKIGYGFAAGYLATHPDLGVMPDLNGSPVGPGQSAIGVNPVTGQKFDSETQDTGPPMTDEEKEREAERLFVLFERLKATGVVDVKNPVQQAFDEGKLG